jgi:hypothetical protein
MNQQLLLLSIGLSLSLFPTTLSLANSSKIPPIERNPAGDSEAAGTRGCDLETSKADLILLTSTQQIQSTISTHPAFFWYLSNIDLVQPPTLRFTLIEPRVPEPIYESKVVASHSGLWVLKLPPQLPGLMQNKEYRWTVTLVCNELKPSSNKSIWAWIQRISPPTTLEQKLANTGSAIQRSQIYAAEGLWQEAYESLIESPANQAFAIFDLENLPPTVKAWLLQKGIAKK